MEAIKPDKTFKLYKGEVTIDFYEKYGRYTHVYIRRETGSWPTSVTKATGVVNKPFLVPWAIKLTRESLLESLQAGKTIDEAMIVKACKLHDTAKDTAAQIGKEVHEWAENWIKTKIKDRRNLDLPKNSKAANGAIAFLKWVEEHDVKFLASEQIVYSKKHNFVGTLDTKCTFGVEKHKIAHIVDFKTSAAIYDEYRWQVSGYQGADEEESGETYGTKFIIRFGKEDGEFEAREYGDHQKDYKTFLGCLTIAKRQKELTKENKRWEK